MVQSVVTTHTVQVVPIGTGCSFEPKVVDHVRAGDKVTFANETDSPARITFSNQLIFDADSIMLEPRPDERTLIVKEGGPGSVQCSVDCNYQSEGAVMLEAKPVVLINRD